MNGKVLLLIAVLCVPWFAAGQQPKRLEPLGPLACRHLADNFAKVGERMELKDLLQLRNCVSRILVKKGRKEMGVHRGTRRSAGQPRLSPHGPLGPTARPGTRMPAHPPMPGIKVRPGTGRGPAMPPPATPGQPGDSGSTPTPEAPRN